jgi:hypothetical protein
LDEIQRKRILIPADAAKAAYVVPHRSLLEFLTGSALAYFTNGSWEWPKEIAPDVWKFVDKKAWHPDWQEPIVFFSGRLTDAAPLLALLGDSARDDQFRHRLALTGRCLAEVNDVTRVSHRAAIKA